MRQFYQATSWLRTPGELSHWKWWFDSLSRTNEIRARDGKWFALFVEMAAPKPTANIESSGEEKTTRVRFSRWYKNGRAGYQYCDATATNSISSQLLNTWGILFHTNSYKMQDRRDEERQRIEIDLIRRTRHVR